MGRLPKDLEAKRLRLARAAHRGAFNSYVRRGFVPDLYDRVAATLNEAKALDTALTLAPAAPARPKGRATTHYVWRTAGDTRVRGAHAARNGQIFAWSTPPEHGHPGTEPNCRCWAGPYYGDPAVPDAVLTMVPQRRANNDPSVLWASIETLNWPDGSLAVSGVVMNDGTTIDSTFARSSVTHQVTLPDGATLRLEKQDDTRALLVAPSEQQPLRLAGIGRAFFPQPPLALPGTPSAEPIPRIPDEEPVLANGITPAAIIVRGALALYNMLRSEPASLGAGTSDVPVVVSRVWQSTAGAAPVVVTETLTLEQVSQLCPRAAEVQNFIDLAAAEWAPMAGTMNASVLGTRIHLSAKTKLDDAKLIDPALYAGLFAEVSLDTETPVDPNRVGVTYGTARSTRLDVLELVSPQMGCVYDYKTGQTGLSAARVAKIIEVWNARFPGVAVTILEMRQFSPVWLK